MMRSNANYGMVSMIFVGALLCALYVGMNVHKRHYLVDGEMYVALHIRLPGYATMYYPEQKVDLRKWTGSKYVGLSAVNNDDNKENPEATAGLALIVSGIFPDYNLKKKDDGHYILYRPEKTKEFFTWGKYYKIWKGEKAEE
ncbi:hypothetical protein ACFL08_04105 [Patescibacteria group bacterium]